MKKKIITFLVIVAVLVGIVGFWNWQRNTYSKEDLKLEILGQDQTTLGEEVEYIVKYKNNGNFRVENPQLIFDPPENSISDGKVLGRQTLGAEKLGDAIYPGEEKTVSFKMRLFGKEGETKIAKAILSYQPKNLKSKNESSTSFTTTIKSVPLTFEFDLSSQIEAGENFRFRINYFSNVNYPLTDLRVQIDYPSGFEFSESVPKAIDKNEWDIPVLNKSEGGKIEIAGSLSAEIGDAKIFRAQLGIWQDGQFIPLKDVEKGVELVKPSVYVRQEINKNPQYSASAGDWLHYEIYFKNIGDDELTNLFIINKLEGEALDFQTLKSDMGAVQAGDNSVIFDWRKISKLQYLAPLEEESVDFWIKVKDDLGNVKNPTLRNKIFIGQVKEEFITKISSKLEVSQKGYFQDEAFGNSGEMPPKVGQPTTYTIVWQAKNYYSDVKNARVKAVLPPQSSLTGNIFPEEAATKFVFDSESREVSWSAGDMEKGVGLSGPGPSIAFQISFIPTQSQIGQSPEIIGEATISGEDSWTDATLEGKSPAVTTALPDDPTINNDMKKVQ